MDTVQRNAEFQKAIKVVRETISTNKDLKIFLKLEIGRAFHDAYEKDGGKKYKTLKQISIIAHKAADKLLNTWCK